MEDKLRLQLHLSRLSSFEEEVFSSKKNWSTEVVEVLWFRSQKHLYKVVMKLLSMPATNVLSESEFHLIS